MAIVRPCFSTPLLPSRLPTFHFSTSSPRFLCSLPSPSSLIFLGTPSVSANVLKKLHQASQQSTSSYVISAVVTQPPARVGRKRTLSSSPVHQCAIDLNLDPILVPESARDPLFIDKIRDLSPDLCITSAYGQFLPQDFLDIPRCGTINIHPSLLPRWRGAAPVQRSLEAGDTETGVSILRTVLEMDAGPILGVKKRSLDGSEQTPQLLGELFDEGADLLLEVLDDVLQNKAKEWPQGTEVTKASKLTKQEARLTFTENAQIVHNKVRGFAGWPGTWGEFHTDGDKPFQLKIGKTCILREQGGMCFGIHQVRFNKEHDCLDITCDDGSKLGVFEVQPPGKKMMSARSFYNGLRKKELYRKHLPH